MLRLGTKLLPVFCNKCSVPVLSAAVAALFCLSLVVEAKATTVLSDNFSTSTIPTGTYPTPTASSTGYAIVSSKPLTAVSIATGDLKFGIAASTSAVVEAQAKFTPVTLSNTGDFVELTLTFTNTAGILTNGTSSQLDFGLYNSGGVAPKTDMQASGLTNGSSSDATGGAQNWLGYISQLFLTAGSSAKTLTRPAQTGTVNTNQDLLTNNASASTSFPTVGTQIGNSSSAADVTLTAGSVYTEDLTATLTATGNVTIAGNLYSGSAVVPGNLISSLINTTTAATTLATTLDAFAFGWRETGNVASQMDVSSVLVQTNVAVPEPCSCLLIGLGVAMLPVLTRSRRKNIG